MDDVRLGRQLRALRHHRGWRQRDVAARAGVSQSLISHLERGQFGGMPVERLRIVARALEAELSVGLRWRAGDLDRLLDERHAEAEGRTAAWLDRRGWETRLEVTFAVFGERGAIDLLAWHAATRTLLVVEVKTELTSVEETLRRLDVKVRLASRVSTERFGWRPLAVGRLLALADSATARRRVERHAAVLDRACPVRGTAVRDWVRSPHGAMTGLVFIATGQRSAAPRQRVRSSR